MGFEQVLDNLAYGCFEETDSVSGRLFLELLFLDTKF